MAQERGYERQVGTPRPVGLPGASPGAFGAGIGGEMAEAGARLHQSELRAYQIDRQEQVDGEIAARSAAMAEARLSLSKAADDARVANPSGAGHTEAMAAQFDQATQGLADDIADDRVRRQIATQLQEQKAGFLAREHAWQVGAVTKARVDDMRTAGDRQSAFVRTGGNPSEAITAINDMIDGMEGLGEYREPVRRELLAKVALAHADRMNDVDPRSLVTAIDGGAFNDVLNGEQISVLRHRGVAGVRVLEQQAEAEAAQRERDAAAAERERQHAAQESIRAIDAKVSAGIVPTAAEIGNATVQARQAGLEPAELINLQAVGVRSAINRTYGAADGDQLRRARDGAFASASENDQIARGQLDKLIDKADSAEAERIKGLMGQGVPGMVQALAQIRGSGERRHDVAEKLGEGLGYVAGLDAAAQRYTLEGKELLKARPKDFGSEDQARARLDARMGELRASLGGMYGPMLDNARQIMAVVRNSKGATGYDEADMDLAIKWATGGSTRRDGAMQGGLGRVRGKPVLLPDWMTAEEFDTVVSRADFSGARYADRSAAGTGAQVAQALRPEWAGEDQDGNPFYRFVDRGGQPLRQQGGGEFRLRFRRR